MLKRCLTSTTALLITLLISAQYDGGTGRGDGADLPVPMMAPVAIHSGGAGRGDGAELPPPLALAVIYNGGEGRGEDADMPAPMIAPMAIFNGGGGRGDDAFVPAPITIPVGIFTGGTGRGDDAHVPPSPVLSSTIFQGGSGRGDRAEMPMPLAVSTSIYQGGTGRGDHMDLFVLPKDLLLSARALLEGPYDGVFGMHDSLRAQGVIPLAEPYSALGFTQIGGGGETIDPAVLDPLMNGNVVDWIFVELRAAADPTEVVATRSALILQNGLIVDLDGTSPVTFDELTPGDYHIVVRHRNHLGVMSYEPIPLDGATASFIDFTQPYTLTFGTEARKSMVPFMVLWAGDVYHNEVLKYIGAENDRDPILTRIGGVVPSNTVMGYHAEDVNMDGTVKYVGEANDRDPILVNIGGTVPTNTRVGTLP